MEVPQLKSLAPRNPLSIIALFISLIYGISALLLGASVKYLQPINQDRLVWFIITFPVLILGGFLLLVIGHHRKLYAPGDFRSDEGFLASERRPETIGQKYLAEAEAEETPDEPDADRSDVSLIPADGDNPTPSEPTTDELARTTEHDTISLFQSRAGSRAAQMYLIEGLVFQDLQNELGTAIQREIMISIGNGRYAHIDGFVDSAAPKIIEVIILHNIKNARNTLQDSLIRLSHYQREFENSGLTNASIILAVVVSRAVTIPLVKRINHDLGDLGIRNLDIRYYNSESLLKKYGLSETSDPQ